MARKAYCKAGDHYPEELLASVYDLPGEEMNLADVVLLTNDGTATNRYYDGTVGVPQETQEQAEADEEPLCAEHLEHIDWEHEK